MWHILKQVVVWGLVHRIWYEPHSLASIEKMSLSLCRKEEEDDGNIFFFNEVGKRDAKVFLSAYNVMLVTRVLIFHLKLGILLTYSQRNDCSRSRPIPSFYHSILAWRLTEWIKNNEVTCLGNIIRPLCNSFTTTIECDVWDMRFPCRSTFGLCACCLQLSAREM
jgi:hypothetical protein